MSYNEKYEGCGFALYNTGAACRIHKKDNARNKDSMKKKSVAVVMCLICVFGLCSSLLGGCSLFSKKYSYSPEENSIYVYADGQITAAIIEDFDKDYYDLEELTGLAQQQVLAYNKSKYGLEYYSYDQLTKEQRKEILLPVSLESVQKKDQKVILILRYANGDTYTGFNGIDIKNAGGSKVFTGAVGNTQMPLEGTFVAAKGGASQLTSELAEKTDYQMLYVDYATKVYFEHDVSYVTNNVAVLTGNSVQTASGQGSMIIFK